MTCLVCPASDLFATPLSCLVVDHPQSLKLDFFISYLDFFLTHKDAAVASCRSRLSGETALKIESVQAVFLGVMF